MHRGVQLKNFPGSGAFAALALSCALGFGSDGCQALALGEYQAKPGDTLDLYVAGSWAQDNTLQQLLQLICETDSLDVYRAPGRYVRLFFCRMKSSQASLAGLPPGQKIAFHKSSIAGGGSGVGPLIQRTPVEFINVEDLRDHLDDRCPAASRMKHAGQGDLSGFTEYECLNPTPRFEVPDVGMSDVEPKFFLNPFGLGPSALEALSVHHPSALIYGVPVSLGLRNALQSARFAKSQPCNPANPHYAERVAAGHGSHVARGETEECMPGLSRVQLAGVFSGALTDWGQIINPEGYPLAAKTRQPGRFTSPPGVRAPSDDRVFVCRRPNTAANQAAYEMFFLNQRCASGDSPFVQSGDNVFQGAVTGDVRSCLAQLDQRNVWAVGILTTENVESVPEDHWRFIKMDGVAPTLLNTYNGHWPFFVEQSYQWRNDRSTQPLQGPKLALMVHIGTQLGNPAVIRDIDREYRHAWGSAGVMALSDANRIPPLAGPGAPVNEAAIEENPTLGVKHDAGNCGALIPHFPTAMP